MNTLHREEIYIWICNSVSAWQIFLTFKSVRIIEHEIYQGLYTAQLKASELETD